MPLLSSLKACRQRRAACRRCGRWAWAISVSANLPPNSPGGEAQRIKLATELQRAQRGHSLYLLDEPTTGLHPADVQLLMAQLHRLVDAGNTVIVVEHDMDVVAAADWVIDLGPAGGDAGGRIVAIGTPATVSTSKNSRTAPYLAAMLGG
jgi:excinuclease ABC subunit A